MNAIVEARQMHAASGSEVFVRFGPERRLTGILSGAHHDGPTLLLPNAGLQPRSGPFRLHVLMAEHLANSGVQCFRYDAPGIGEAPRVAGCDAVQASIAAIDALQAAHGCHTFAIGGICSAADTGWEVTISDARVSGLLLLDGVVFTGPWYHYAKLLGLLRRLPSEWKHFANRLPAKLKPSAGLDSRAFRSWPDKTRAREQFSRMVARDVRMLCIFSGGYADRFLHHRQFAWSFGPDANAPGVSLHYWPDCDHTYFGRAQRERLIQRTSDWMLGFRPGRPS
ncbi:hypothetical protein [Aerolutibacter daejeonensis]|nr:hypothetical protein [Lysobacter daejeonensis]